MQLSQTRKTRHKTSQRKSTFLSVVSDLLSLAQEFAGSEFGGKGSLGIRANRTNLPRSVKQTEVGELEGVRGGDRKIFCSFVLYVRNSTQTCHNPRSK